MSQKCDGIFDCHDFSDECNESCYSEILEGLWLKCTCWLMGSFAILFNLVALFHGFSSIKKCKTEAMMITKVLMNLIGCGDLLMGLYLVALYIYDSFTIYGLLARRKNFRRGFARIRADTRGLRPVPRGSAGRPPKIFFGGLRRTSGERSADSGGLRADTGGSARTPRRTGGRVHSINVRRQKPP